MYTFMRNMAVILFPLFAFHSNKTPLHCCAHFMQCHVENNNHYSGDECKWMLYSVWCKSGYIYNIMFTYGESVFVCCVVHWMASRQTCVKCSGVTRFFFCVVCVLSLWFVSCTTSCFNLNVVWTVFFASLKRIQPPNSLQCIH